MLEREMKRRLELHVEKIRAEISEKEAEIEKLRDIIDGCDAVQDAVSVTGWESD